MRLSSYSNNRDSCLNSYNGIGEDVLSDYYTTHTLMISKYKCNRTKVLSSTKRQISLSDHKRIIGIRKDDEIYIGLLMFLSEYI